jgi:hypothetical protein
MPTSTLERPVEAQPDTLPDTGPTVGQLVQENAVIFRVTTGQFGQSKKLEHSQYEVDAERKYVKASKVLLACPETDAIKTFFSEIRTYLESVSSPSNFKRGDYLLSIDLLLKVDERMKDYQEQLRRLSNVLVANYTERVNDERSRLRTTFNPADYPPARSVADRYFIKWQYLSLATPRNRPSSLAAQEQEKLADMWQEAGEGVRDLLRASLAEVVGHLQERLTGATDGKPKIFRDSAVANVREFLAGFDARNITNDAECALLVQKVRDMLKDVTPEALRTDTALKVKVREGFSDITAQLDAMTVNKPKKRRFSLGEEE